MEAGPAAASAVIARVETRVGAAGGPTALPVSETFCSIQGEGMLVGVPSYFIRLSGCNLRCSWCDTPYASWNPEGASRAIADLVCAATASGVRHAVVTGGEPMIFAGVGELTNGLRRAGMHVTIETAGTVFREIECDLMSLSPKLSNSTPARDDPRDPSGVWHDRHEARRIDGQALQKLIDAYPARQFKFVVRGPADLAEIDGLLARLTGWRRDEIMLMPEGVTPPTAELKAWVAATCLQRGWRYAQRLHIELFGNTRGT